MLLFESVEKLLSSRGHHTVCLNHNRLILACSGYVLSTFFESLLYSLDSSAAISFESAPQPKSAEKKSILMIVV